MENVSCIICNSSKFDLFKKFNINNCQYVLVKCISCSFVFLNPRISEEDIFSYYDSNYLPFQKKRTFTNTIYKILRKINFNFKYKILNKSLKNKSKNLDIGSGDNFFSSALKNKNWISHSYDKYNKSDTNIKNLMNVKSKTYNSITLWHSIEHMYDINNIFKNIKNILTDDGYLFIACPNIDSLDSKLLKENWVAYDLPRHIYHFNYTSMKNFLVKHNFEIDSIDSLKIDVLFNVIMSKNVSIFYKVLIIVISYLYQIFNIKKSSTIVYICKKI